MVSASPILAGSIISKSKIKATGQEIGEEYDMINGTGGELGKEFNHTWE